MNDDIGVQIGNVNIPGRTALAPLAGITDRSFRMLCRQQGASFAVTEMVSAKGLAEGSERSNQYLDFEADEFPISAQVFGSEPEVMAEGARVVAERNPDIIDINCGCPVKKIVTKNAGAALLKTPDLLGQIIASMVHAVDIPVTLKIRSGWAQADQAVEVARIAERFWCSGNCRAWAHARGEICGQSRLGYYRGSQKRGFDSRNWQWRCARARGRKGDDAKNGLRSGDGGAMGYWQSMAF